MTNTTTATLNEFAPEAARNRKMEPSRQLTNRQETIRQETKKTRRRHNLVWFELPVTDLPLAIAFYEVVFATELKIDPRFPELAIFPRLHEDSITGALIQSDNLNNSNNSDRHNHADNGNHISRPSDQGAIVYLNCDGDLDGVLARTHTAGGAVLQEVAQLPGDMGWIAQIRDLDGNRIGLHATF